MFKRTDFKKLELYGNGKKNTRVYRVKHLKTGKTYVLKEVEARSLEKLNEYKEEAVQLSKLQHHPNILQFFGYYFYETPHNTFKLGIISESINKDTNLEILFRKREKTNQYWTENQLVTMIYSLVDAFAYLEYNGICHRDIKPTNLFLMEDFQMKVIDFGESKEFIDEEDEDEKPYMATIRGTPQYLSPILWEGHVIARLKQIEHNMFKSDVFSAGLVLFQMASLQDVSGFNQKTEECDGEKLIQEGMKMLGQRYSHIVTDALGLMLKFKESERPNFIELAAFIVGEDTYVPKCDKSIFDVLKEKKEKKYKRDESASSFSVGNNDISKGGNLTKKTIYFNRYKLEHNLTGKSVKNAYWFEFGGNMIARHNISATDTTSKWRLIAKFKSTFPTQFITVYTGEKYGFFLIGGTNSNNTYQFLDSQIIKKNSMNLERSFMSVVVVDPGDTPSIFIIGGYDYTEKCQLSSIEVYDVKSDVWSMNSYQDLKVARSQASALLFDDKKIYVFGGYNKSLGTLNTIEEISIDKKICNIIDFKLPIPLRRFATVKITKSKVLILGGITRLCKESDSSYVIDMENGIQRKSKNLQKAGTIEAEPFFDEVGDIHIFFENKYGTSPPLPEIYNFLDYK